MAADLQCPYCGSDLEHHDLFGRFAGFGDGKVNGDIYKCPKGAEESEDCESSCFHVAGSFYTFRDGDGLYDGYPC